MLPSLFMSFTPPLLRISAFVAPRPKPPGGTRHQANPGVIVGPPGVPRPKSSFDANL